MPGEYGYRTGEDMDTELEEDVPTLEAAMDAMSNAMAMMRKAITSQNRGIVSQKPPSGGPLGVASMAV